jgi:hypothetical protein
MKLLLLSLCGRDHEEEDVRYLNLYLASLRRHVIPHFETHVLLFSTFNAKARTQARVEAFGLTPYVTVLRLEDMGLPEEAVTSINALGYFHKIGMHMNLLFDYAQQHSFFDADWIFHTDTDIEFLDNFAGQLSAITALQQFNSKIIISCAGDSNRAFIRYKDTEYRIVPPPRWHAYTEPYPTKNFDLQLAKLETNRIWSEFQLGEWLTVEPESLKIRNDFVGISRAATADAAKFNWVSLTFVIKDSRELQNNSEIVSNWWKRHEATTDLPLHVAFNLDKGASVLYDVKTGKNGGLTWIQLRPYEDMAKHYSSGWLDGQRYIDTSHAILKEHYADSESVWQHDYV